MKESMDNRKLVIVNPQEDYNKLLEINPHFEIQYMNGLIDCLSIKSNMHR